VCSIEGSRTLLGVTIAAIVALFLVAASPVAANEHAKLHPVKIRGKSLVVAGKPFFSYGFNYGPPVTRYIDDPRPRRLRLVRIHMRRAKSLGANTLRVSVELTQIMRSPTEIRKRGLRAVNQVLALAERERIYIDFVGNVAWRTWRRKHWYESLGERTRWRVQERFWRTIARIGVEHSSILSYELTSEPSLTNAGTWYTGSIGPYEFVQLVARRIQGRDPYAIAREWTSRLASAIRSEDRRHAVTIGMLPLSKGPFAPENVGRYLDILSVHEYPLDDKVHESMALIKHYESYGKPLILGETFAFCAIDTFKGFLHRSASHLDGAYSFFWGETPKQIRKESPVDTMKNHIAGTLSAFVAAKEGFVRANARAANPDPGR